MARPEMDSFPMIPISEQYTQIYKKSGLDHDLTLGSQKLMPDRTGADQTSVEMSDGQMM